MPIEKCSRKRFLRDGVKVIIADKECGITHNRTVLKEERKITKKYGYLPKKTHMNVTQDVCENCLECTKATACPGLTNGRNRLWPEDRYRSDVVRERRGVRARPRE